MSTDLQLTLTRDDESPARILGEICINDATFCQTLERPREGVYPCIPEGTYRVVIDWSNRFGKRMPHILDVPGREGIRIHPGNFPTDSEGCVLVGRERRPDAVLFSQEVFRKLFALLDSPDTGAVTLTVRKAEPKS